MQTVSSRSIKIFFNQKLSIFYNYNSVDFLDSFLGNFFIDENLRAREAKAILSWYLSEAGTAPDQGLMIRDADDTGLNGDGEQLDIQLGNTCRSVCTSPPLL